VLFNSLPFITVVSLRLRACQWPLLVHAQLAGADSTTVGVAPVQGSLRANSESVFVISSASCTGNQRQDLKRSLALMNNFATGRGQQSKEQARNWCTHFRTLRYFSEPQVYERPLMQPALAGTFHPDQPGKHKEQAELPRHPSHGGYNLPVPVPALVNLHEPAAAGAMVGIIDFNL
jgi:hypothetical protein